MKIFIKLAFMLFAFASTNLLIAEPVILKPVITPEPTEFSSVNGIIGLNSETLSGGNVSVRAGSYFQEIPLDTSGNFNLTVAANSNYNLKATLTLENGLPGVNASYINYPALSPGETQTLDLRRPSGQLLGRVNIIGGTVQNLSLYATATATNGGITEQFNVSDNLTSNGTQAAEVLFAFPANIASIVSGQVQITSTNGCLLDEPLPVKSITLDDRATGITEPNTVNWTIDVTNSTCNTGSINGQVRLDGIDSSIVLSQHQLSFIGPDFINLTLASFGTYQVSSLLEGEYGVSQTSMFSEPYSILRYPYENIIVSGATTYNTVYPVGTSHGAVQLVGDWNLANTKTANIEASGSLPGSTSDSLSASDIINPADGSFDFVLINGDWQANKYNFDFETIAATRTDSETLKVELLHDSMLNIHNITQAASVNLIPVSFNTAMAQVDLLVEQTPGQSPVTIERLFLNGSSDHIDPASNTLLAKTSVSANSSGSPESSFQFTVYGLPGTYTLTARGTGSDGRSYSETFELTLGTVSPPDPEPDPDKETMACFGINKVKLHRYNENNKYDFSKDKLYIKYAAFSLPENADVDLNQDDVSISIDGKRYDFPSGSLKQHGNKQRYSFKSSKGDYPEVKFDIDFKKAKWNLKLSKEDTSYIDNSDGVDISLSIGNYIAEENILLNSKNKHHNKFIYKRKPKLSCRIKNKHSHKKEKDDDDDSDDSDNDTDNQEE